MDIPISIAAYEQHQYSSLEKAAIAYGLPPSTVQHHKPGRKPQVQAHEDHQLLTAAEEDCVVDYCSTYVLWGTEDDGYDTANSIRNSATAGNFNQGGNIMYTRILGSKVARTVFMTTSQFNKFLSARSWIRSEHWLAIPRY
ncbi:hypothetical protein BGX38DRAFT_597560 [Terfezia claveryi]|nr:hypothetical protein BGX38DRAFT_597560 [Terfezia claveryi]